MSRVSASRAALLHECGWWARADSPRVDAEPGSAAKDGTALHALVDAYLGDRMDDAARARILADAADPARVERLWSHAKAWLVVHKSPWMRSEIAFAWDPASDRGRELTDTLAHLGLSGPRPYAKPDAWRRICEAIAFSERAIPGTADLVTIVDGTVVVYDWCTGHTDKREQLRALALMIARAQEAPLVRMVTLRLDDAGIVEDDHGTVDDLDLAALAGEYAGLVDGIESAAPTPGAHCARMYCPAYLGCPTTQEGVAQLIPAEKLTAGSSVEADRRLAYRLSVDIESTDHAAWLLPRVNLLRDAAEAMREALKGWADEHGGIPSAPGKQWGPVDVERKDFSRDKAEALLRLLGATEEQIASCVTQRSITQHRETNVKKGRKRAA